MEKLGNEVRKLGDRMKMRKSKRETELRQKFEKGRGKWDLDVAEVLNDGRGGKKGVSERRAREEGEDEDRDARAVEDEKELADTAKSAFSRN